MLNKRMALLCLTVIVTMGVTLQAMAEAYRPSTAQPEVSVLPQEIDMPGLARKRRIRMYLPPDYATSNKRYPVLYMHDGQNLFDDATSYIGEWHVDESLNDLARAGKLELIVVGIDNGMEKRMTELNPWNSRFGTAEGRQYVDFVVKTLKPMIDQEFRTKPDRANTAIMGSSMGGLISHYAIVQYPEVFSKAGIFSPAYWIGGPDCFDFFATHAAAKDARLYFLMGELEGDSMVPDVRRVDDDVLKSGHPAANALLKVVPGAHHNETLWSAEFEQAVLWLFKSG